MDSGATTYRIIISGGGTGGHIYPAIAIANQVRHLHPDTEILFVGAEGKMEMEMVPKAGYRIAGLRISGIQRRLTLDNLSFPFKLLSSLRAAGRILKKFRPHVVVGVGGYASGPVLWQAVSAGIPTLIQEQNSYAGITNRLLGRRVDRICVAYQRMERYFPGHKIVITGNPVRGDIAEFGGSKEEAVRAFGLDHRKKTVLAIGGSLGARTINESMLGGTKLFGKHEVQVIWQAGRLYIEEMRQRLAEGNPVGIQLTDFIGEMGMAYAAADLVISRAGALAISELCVAGKPAILVPSPNVAEDHQTRNARALVERDAATMVSDKEAMSRLVKEAVHLLKDHDRLESMSVNIKRMARPDAAKDIADEVIKLAR